MEHEAAAASTESFFLKNKGKIVLMSKLSEQELSRAPSDRLMSLRDGWYSSTF